jgi:hypothetical protein
MATKAEPTSTIEKSKYFNRMDEAHDLLYMSVSPDLWFHVDACTTLNGIWTTLVDLFGKQDKMRGHMLKVELNSLDPKSFDNIQDFFTKFKSLLNLKGCGVDESTQEKQLVLSILAKLGPEYVVFVSTFHSGRYTSRSTWTMPTLAKFIESITHESNQRFQGACTCCA